MPYKGARRDKFFDWKRRLGLIAAARVLGHCSWLRGRHEIVRLLLDPDCSPSYPFEVEFYGHIYTGNLNCFLDWNVYFFGAYEATVLCFLRELMCRMAAPPVVLDIGANVGHHSLFMSKWARHVHAFEPWEKVREQIVTKIERNGLKNVTVHGVALGTRDEARQFYAPLGANTGTGSFTSTHAADRNRSYRPLPLVNGDSYLLANGITHVDLVKIDCEGWEKYVLEGLRQTLERDAPVVFMEVSDSTLSTVAAASDLFACIPDCYEAMYVDIPSRGPAVYSPFDASRPGDVLLRPTAAARMRPASTQRSTHPELR